MDPLGPGRIVWAVYPGGRGGGKERPMVVTSRRADLIRTDQVFAVVCSTDFREPLEPDEVRLPSNPEGRCVTRLREDTVAVCNWTTPIPVDQIQRTGGLVPTTLLREICRKAGITYVPER
jgi:mRNA-degrading endonuclease toxin of MazEF toxin-antitoxin module